MDKIDLLFLPGIWLIDVINQIASPYKAFTRPASPKYQESLEQKEQKFYTDLQRFWIGDVLSYRFPIGDAGDQCLHHGLYTTMLVMKAVRTHDCVDANRAVDGLKAHHVGGLLVRGVQADGTVTQDVSNDQLSGHLLALYYVWKYLNPLTGAHLIEEVAQELLDNNHCLVNQDGSVTKHGRLINGFLTDPLNLTLCLAVYLLAYKATHKLVYWINYKKLLDQYKWRIPYANFRFLWLGQNSTPLRAAIHYHILCALDMRPEYHKGMKRLVKMQANTGSPVVTWLAYGFGMSAETAVKVLSEYTLEDKQWSVTRVNSGQNETVSWGGLLRVRQPLPRYKVRSEEFCDAREWHSCDDVGTGEEHNGGDFLLGYWGLRFLNLL